MWAVLVGGLACSVLYFLFDVRMSRLLPTEFQEATMRVGTRMLVEPASKSRRIVRLGVEAALDRLHKEMTRRQGTLEEERKMARTQRRTCALALCGGEDRDHLMGWMEDGEVLAEGLGPRGGVVEGTVDKLERLGDGPLHHTHVESPFLILRRTTGPHKFE